MIGLTVLLLAQAATAADQPFMTKEAFVSYGVTAAEPKRQFECSFRDAEGRNYAVELVQTGGYRSFEGGYPEVRPPGGLNEVVSTPSTQVVHDDTTLFSDSDIPILNEFQTSMSTRDGGHSFRLSLHDAFARDEAFPAVLEVTARPPSIHSTPEPPKPVVRPGSMVGFCKRSETRQEPLSFEELDALGRNGQ